MHTCTIQIIVIANVDLLGHEVFSDESIVQFRLTNVLFNCMCFIVMGQFISQW
jgi:hypothetical protein